MIGLDLDEPGWGPSGGQDIYTALVYAVNGNFVRDVMVDGDWLMRNGHLMTIDFLTSRRALDTANTELSRRVRNSM
jgi:cytosine/adenosine deaminase-related metal-dependent hydrolase